MGVYIDMEMPSSCFDCPLGISVNFGVLCCPTHTIISDDNLFDADGRELRRQDWCPLAEVPEPHGDLIDRNALLEGEGRYSISLCKEGIDVEEILRAKTIIPSSKEGET